MSDPTVTARLCPVCEEPMPPRHEVACSRRCRQRLHRAAGVRYYEGTCRVCGKTWPTNRQNTTICSDECKSIDYRKPRTPVQVELPFYAQKGAIREAYDAGNGTALVAALRPHCRVDEGGCWRWQRQKREGYAVASLKARGSTDLVHRGVITILQGDPGFMPVHHKCGNRDCINPDHLQVVTPAENTAEMLERRHYLGRIAALEAALADLDDCHPLLT